ncbi:RsfA family transcriptional regulator [Bacillus weihaiensis]|uniref:RsfA family transcriptional regulator n=1 Tax=Bacillus weihaiensis TaxID=1547283 RepID=UPI00235691B3|nr:RsfA family transcriptional regulator [Bacillus weihaiensis]
MKKRQDAWSNEEDELLAKTILAHIREGGTQSAAYKVVGDKIARTESACSYRWNSVIRKNYKEAIEEAKRKKNHIRTSIEESIQDTSLLSSEQSNSVHQDLALTLEDCIGFLQKTLYQQSSSDIDENSMLKEKNTYLRDQNNELVSKFNELIKEKEKLEKEYKVLIHVLTEINNQTKENLYQERVH